MDITFPKHKASLHLTHNQHKDYYETVEEYLESFDKKDAWVSEEQYHKAIETQDFWELHWYPATPVGYYCLLAHDLDTLLKEALEVEQLDIQKYSTPTPP